MSILNFFENRHQPTEAEILNAGLSWLIKLDFNFNKSIAQKLQSKYPSLSSEILVDYEQKCINARSFGHDIIYNTMLKRLKAYDPMKKKELKELYRSEMVKSCSWVNSTNLRRIYNATSYLLGRDGWWEFKK